MSFGPGPHIYTPPGLYWTTEDELLYVRHLHAVRNVRALESYLQTAIVRSWIGPGMRVEPGIVILCARDLLEDLRRLGFVGIAGKGGRT